MCTTVHDLCLQVKSVLETSSFVAAQDSVHVQQGNKQQSVTLPHCQNACRRAVHKNHVTTSLVVTRIGTLTYHQAANSDFTTMLSTVHCLAEK